MAQRQEVPGALGGRDAGDARHASASPSAPFPRQSFDHLPGYAKAAARDRGAARLSLAADVDHAGCARRVQVGEARALMTHRVRRSGNNAARTVPTVTSVTSSGTTSSAFATANGER